MLWGDSGVGARFLMAGVNRIPNWKYILERTLFAFILFYSALTFCLPVPFSEQIAQQYPWWAIKISIGNVQLHEILFLGWLAFYGGRSVLRSLLFGGIPARQSAIWLIALALWCGLVSLSAPMPWQDIGRTFRLLLGAALLLAVVRWTRQSGNFPLEMLIFGFFIGTIINLIISFQYPFIVNGMMRLSGQNTPGVAMGVAIHLTAWLFFRSGHLKVQAFALCATLVFAFACAISYSRIGWIAGGLGLIVWAYILLVGAQPLDYRQQQRMKRLRLALVPLLFVSLVIAPMSNLVQDGLQWAQALVEQKTSRQDESDGIRFAYFIGTTEIVSRYPLGVGYSGFYDAMTATDVYRSGNAAEEDSPADANPHATFLWYATAGGIPGGLMVLMVFVMLLNSLRFGLTSAMGHPGLILFAFAALSFLLIGSTVPYLLNSIILIVPAGIAAGWGWTQRVEQAASMLPNIDYRHAKKTLRFPESPPAVP